MASATKIQTHHDQQQPSTTAADPKLAHTDALEWKVSAIENDGEYHPYHGGNDRKALLEIGKSIKALDIFSAESFYTTPREVIQATAQIQLSPSIFGDGRMPDASPSSSPVAETTLTDSMPLNTSKTGLAYVASDGESATSQCLEPNGYIANKINMWVCDHQGAEEPMPKLEVPVAPTHLQITAPQSAPTTALPQRYRSLTSSNQDQAQDRTPDISSIPSPSPHPSSSHPPSQTSPTLTPSLPPPTEPTVDKSQETGASTLLSAPILRHEDEGNVGTAIGDSLLGESSYSELLYPARTPSPLRFTSARSSLDSVAGSLVASEPNCQQARSAVAHVPASLYQKQSSVRPSSSLRTSASAAILVVEKDVGDEVGSGPATRTRARAGQRTRRPSASSIVSATNRRHWSDSMPTRPQPSRTTTKHSFVPMQPLARSMSREFEQVSIISASTTVAHATTMAKAATRGATAAEAIVAGLDQPWDQPEFKQFVRSLMSMLEEYEELSERILESLILSTRHAAHKPASGSGLGYGDDDKNDGGVNEWDPVWQRPDEIQDKYSAFIKASWIANAGKGKSRRDGLSPPPLFESEAIQQEIELDRLPMPRYEGQPWPQDLLRRQQLARKVTIWIAVGWPKIYAPHQPLGQIITSNMVKQRNNAVSRIKDAMVTFWSLENQFYEKTFTVLDILRDSDELKNDNVKLLKDRHLCLLTDTDTPTLSAIQVDSLEHLVKADHERLQKLTEPLSYAWVSLLLLESDAVKVGSNDVGSHSLYGSLSALLLPMSFSAMNSTATVNHQQQNGEQGPVVQGHTILGLGRNKRFAVKVAILLLLGACLIGMGLLINTQS